MVSEVIENYVIVGIACFLAGLLVTRFYYRKETERRNIGEAFEFAMLDDKVSKLSSLTESLNATINEIKECSEDITERLMLIKDLEEAVSEKATRTKRKQSDSQP